MTLMDEKNFGDWDNFYKENKVEEMPWYNANLDANLENYIKANNLHGGKFLDLGTGPGTQAIQLDNLGFDVTGTDISENAIVKARKLSDKVRFLTDDFLNSKLLDKEFNYIFEFCDCPLPIVVYLFYLRGMVGTENNFSSIILQKL